jgi:flagellar L-ring protein FlgH
MQNHRFPNCRGRKRRGGEMKIYSFLFAAFGCILFSTSGAGYSFAQSPSTGRDPVSLYCDVKAMKVGDVLSVIISESNAATKNSRTTTQKQNSAATKGAASSGVLQGLFPGIGGSIDLSDKYNGQGTTTRSGQLTSRMTVRVVDVLPNHDLLVEGTKTLEINDDLEVVTLSGVVRPADITSANTINSSQIGNAKFIYKGKGALSTAQRAGILTRIINWIL